MAAATAEGDADTAARRWRLPDRLPPLSGWMRTLFLAIWGALFVFAAGVFVVSLPSAFETPPLSPSLLVGLNLHPDDPSVILLTVGDEAARAGIRKGDRLLRINGQPVVADQGSIGRQLTGPLGERVAVDVQARDGSVSRHWLTRDRAHSREGYAEAGLTRIFYFAVVNFFLWLASFVLLVCAVILVARRLREPLAPWASLMMVVVALGTGGIDFWLTNAGGAWAAIAFWANSALFSPMVLAVLPNGSLRPRWTWAVLVAAPILTCLAVVLPELVAT
jgi:drug/metabolite transporter (DMT)-like permease